MSTIDKNTPASERVRAGAWHLDAYGPIDWIDKIDLDRLTMSNGIKCVLGQLYGTFEAGQRALGISDLRAAKLGYDRLDGDDTAGWSDLDYAWRMEIAKRRRSAATPAPEAEPESASAPVERTFSLEEVQQLLGSVADEADRVWRAGTVGDYTFHGIAQRKLSELR